MKIWTLTPDDSHRIDCTHCGKPAKYGYKSTGGTPFRYVCDDHKPVEHKVQARANSELSKLAVNTYEARTQLIRQLTEALEEARICLVIEGYHHDTDTAQPYKIMRIVDAALEAAKKAKK